MFLRIHSVEQIQLL